MYENMIIGQRQELVSRLTSARVEAHCGANTYQARKASAEASDHWRARLAPRWAEPSPETAFLFFRCHQYSLQSFYSFNHLSAKGDIRLRTF